MSIGWEYCNECKMIQSKIKKKYIFINVYLYINDDVGQYQ